MGFFEDMEKFKRGMKQLETEYEQWFSGALKQPPQVTKKRSRRHHSKLRPEPSAKLG